MSVFLNLDASGSESDGDERRPSPRALAPPQASRQGRPRADGASAATSAPGLGVPGSPPAFGVHPSTPSVSGAERARALVLDGPEDDPAPRRQFSLESPTQSVPGRVFQAREEENEEAETLRLRLEEPAGRKTGTPSGSQQSEQRQAGSGGASLPSKASFRGNVSSVGAGPSWSESGQPKQRGGRKTRDTATQTEGGEGFDFSLMPSAHILGDRMSGVIGSDSKQALRQRIKSARRSKFSPEPRSLDLDAPRRLQERENIRKNLSGFALVWHDIKQWWHLQSTKRRDPIPFWRNSIKIIEGRFGSGIASFFVFIRWIFILNICISTVYASFVWIPMAVNFEYDNVNSTMKWYNVFDGKGALGDTWMYFGGYESRIGSYRMDLAYILVPILILLSCFFFILRTIAHSIGTLDNASSLVRTDTRMPYSLYILASWDHTINSEQGVHNLRLGISNAIIDQLHDEAIKNRDAVKERTFDERIHIYGYRVLVWVIWMLLMSGAFAAVWFLLQNDDPQDTSFINVYDSVMVLAALNVFVPMLMSYIVRLEAFQHPKTELQITIVRTFLLRILTIYALLYGLYRKTDLQNEQYPLYVEGDRVSQNSCAGTIIGQEVYKLIIVDIVVSLTGQMCLTLFKVWWTKERTDLDITEGVLQLIYHQGLIWSGMTFSPIVPIIGLMANTLFFVVYKYMVMGWCHPPKKRWNQNRHNTFFMSFLVITLIMVAIPVTIALQWYKPNCGAYGADTYASTFDAIWDWIKTEGKGLETFTHVIFHPAFVIPVFIVLVTVLYVLKVMVRRHKALHAETLREMQQLRQDRQFLLNQALSQNEARPMPPRLPTKRPASAWDWEHKDYFLD